MPFPTYLPLVCCVGWKELTSVKVLLLFSSSLNRHPSPTILLSFINYLSLSQWFWRLFYWLCLFCYIFYLHLIEGIHRFVDTIWDSWILNLPVLSVLFTAASSLVWEINVFCINFQLYGCSCSLFFFRHSSLELMTFLSEMEKYIINTFVWNWSYTWLSSLLSINNYSFIKFFGWFCTTEISI